MTHGSLFSGIGGFDLAAQWMGWQNIFAVEWGKYQQAVLRKNFPELTIYGDITQFDGTPYRGAVDVLSGGFPCQPFSTAGKRKGTEDNRHLWPEMLRVIREVQPQWVVGENVAGLITWERGLVFEMVCADLEAAAYEVQPMVIPACGIDAPHKRDRIWFVAHSIGSRSKSRQRFERIQLEAAFQQKTAETFSTYGETRAAAITNQWREWPTQSPVCRGNDGIPNRVDRIAALGNAIVPQVAHRIFQAIQAVELQLFAP